MIPTLALLAKYRSRDLDQALLEKLAMGLPNIRNAPAVQELCLQQNGVPRFDCGQFALGLEMGKSLMPELLKIALAELKTRFGLEELKSASGSVGRPSTAGHRDLREA